MEFEEIICPNCGATLMAEDAGITLLCKYAFPSTQIAFLLEQHLLNKFD